MRVRVWNAYASNNSGSYTIVGELPSAEVATDVAAALAKVIEAHTAWRDAWDGDGSTDDSPLGEFCRENGLTWREGEGGWDDWPQYSEDNRPRIAVVGRQIVVHHPYTVSLPPALGELFYKRGGRVAHEENHAHHPLVVLASYYWGWKPEDKARQSAERGALLDTLLAEGGALAATALNSWAPAWRACDEFLEAPLTVGAIFGDLVEGVAALRAAGERHGATMHVRIHEAPSETADPFVHLRPSKPAVPRFDVVLRAPGSDEHAVLVAMFEALGLYEAEAKRALSSLPAVVARSRGAAQAERIAKVLRDSGSTVDLARNDG